MFDITSTVHALLKVKQKLIEKYITKKRGRKNGGENGTWYRKSVKPTESERIEFVRKRTRRDPLNFKMKFLPPTQKKSSRSRLRSTKRARVDRDVVICSTLVRQQE